MTDIGKNIRRIRTSIGMTQEELAKKMGYKSKTTINKIELGVNDIPQTKIKLFAEVLGTTPAHLMGWEKEVEEKPVETANRLADLFIGLEIKEDANDSKLAIMIDEYKQLDESKKEQVREYVHFLLERS